MEHFNRLTPAEDERLALVLEECGEVIQIIGKILRHGYDSRWPENNPVNNREILSREVGDLLFSLAFLGEFGDILPEITGEYIIKKAEKLNKWFHHNEVSESIIEELKNANQ